MAPTSDQRALKASEALKNETFSFYETTALASPDHPMLPSISTFVEQVNSSTELTKHLTTIQEVFEKHFEKRKMNKDKVILFNSLINRMNDRHTSYFEQQRETFVLATDGYTKKDCNLLSEATLKGVHRLKTFHIDMAATCCELSDNFKEVPGLKDTVRSYSDAVYSIYGDVKPKAPDCFLIPIQEHSQPN